MKLYAGHYNDKEKNKLSASGGAATVFSELIISKGGIVYGAMYAEDCYSARYGYAENVADLDCFRGSKYSYVNKIVIREGRKVGLYEDIVQQLMLGRTVLLIGLGCDIGNMYSFLKKRHIDDKNLYTVELLCHGTTHPKVHKDYVEWIEKECNSKVVGFNLRHKEENLEPVYIHITLANNKVINKRYDYSEYAYAFYRYKMKFCYACKYKGIGNHKANIAIGDYWGCIEGMEGYDPSGVSLIIVQDDNGIELMNMVDSNCYNLTKIHDSSYAFKNNMSYLDVPSLDTELSWIEIDNDISKNGLLAYVHKEWERKMPSRLFGKTFDRIVIWGAGEMLKQCIDEINSLYNVSFICDNNSNKWEKEIKNIKIVSPRKLLDEKKVFVIIVANNPQIKVNIINELLDMGISDFDIFENWILYAKAGVFNRGKG